jgi:CheY-like chemotaxis protein
MRDGGEEQKRTILLADRDATTILFEKVVLGENDYNFLAATTVRDAVALTLEHELDLILVDDTMPDRSGLSVCSVLREACAGRETPIVIVSGTGDPSYDERVRESGCSAHVRKPLSARELRRVVGDLLAPAPVG